MFPLLRHTAGALLLAQLLFFLPPLAHGREINGTVSRITDGDTLTVRTLGKRTVKARLAGIDAPEKRQAWGMQASQSLTRLCLGTRVRLLPVERDRYGRQVARVFCNDRDAGRAQVAAGLAWADPRHAHDPALPGLQADARAARRGLWREARPTPPWEWRRQQGPASTRR